MYKLLLGLLVAVILSGCQDAEATYNKFDTGNPAAADFLDNDPHADIFEYGGIIYVNAKQIDWVMEENIKTKRFIGEIAQTTTKAKAFHSLTASKLPVGTKVYETNSPIMIAKVDGKEYRYLGMREGQVQHLLIFHYIDKAKSMIGFTIATITIFTSARDQNGW